MNHFQFKDSELYAEDVALKEIAGTVGTPLPCPGIGADPRKVVYSGVGKKG